jgi:hypothetical protein
MSAKAGEADNDEEDEASMDQSESTAHKEDPDEALSHAKKDKVPSANGSEKVAVKVEKDTSRSSLDVLSKAATSSFLMQAEPGQTESRGKRKKLSEDVPKESVDDEAVDDASTGDAAELANISSKRRKMWSALLVKRPRTKDPRHLSSWLNEVLTVSDFETPLEQVEPMEPKAVSSDSSGTSAEKGKAAKEIEERPSSGKEKKSGEKEKKKRKIESRSSEDGASNGKSKKDKEDKVSKKTNEKKSSETSSTEKKSSKKSGSKESPSTSKKEPEDGFVGSFADWRDRKKEKALSKKGSGSLRK